MSDEKFDSFDDFWPHYLAEHSDPTNRLLHVLGTSAAIGLAAAGAVKKEPKLLALAPLVGYGAAWIGHFLVEKNKPATFGNPLYSLRGDFKMLRLVLTDQMDEEMLRLVAEGKTSARGLLEEMAAAE